MVEKYDIMFKILHKSNAFDPIRDPETSDIVLILQAMLFGCPHIYYNDCNLSLKDRVFHISNKTKQIFHLIPTIP